MRPRIALLPAVLRSNLQAWQAFCGVPVRAVVKADGYGWGAEQIAGAIDDLVAAYCVADADEFRALRPHTLRPIILLNDVNASYLEEILDAGGVPNVSAHHDVEIVEAWTNKRGRRPLVRVGVAAAVGWSGIRAADGRAFAAAVARRTMDVELWTHPTDAGLAGEQIAALFEVRDRFREAGAAVRAIEYRSTASLSWAADQPIGDSVRIGIGLFGASLALGPVPVPELRCALEVHAPVVRRIVTDVSMPVGYGTQRVDAGERLLTVRCGYADGYPRTLAQKGKVLAVGMQYTTCFAEDNDRVDAVALIDAATDLDALSADAMLLPHELVARLGAHRSSPHSLMELHDRA